MVGFQRKPSGGDRLLGRSSGSCEPEDRGGGIFINSNHIRKIFTLRYGHFFISMVSFSSGRSNRKLFSFFNFMGCDDNHLLLAAVTKISIIYF